MALRPPKKLLRARLKWAHLQWAVRISRSTLRTQSAHSSHLAHAGRMNQRYFQRHHESVLFDESALETGVALYAQLAIDSLEELNK